MNTIFARRHQTKTVAQRRAELTETYQRIADMTLMRERFSKPFNWAAWYADLGKIEYAVEPMSNTELRQLYEYEIEREISQER